VPATGARRKAGAEDVAVRLFIGFLLWCLLLVLSWPLAILAVLLYPIVWLLLLPFRLIAAALRALLALVGAVLLLPARLLGWRPSH